MRESYGGINLQLCIDEELLVDQHNKRFEQSPDSNVSIHSNPGFYVYVWPLRARLPLGTAQLKRSVMATTL